jgi:hypothetical protein
MTTALDLDLKKLRARAFDKAEWAEGVLRRYLRVSGRRRMTTCWENAQMIMNAPRQRATFSDLDRINISANELVRRRAERFSA